MHKREIRGLISAMLLGDGSLSCKYNAHRKGQDIADLTGVGITYHMAHNERQEDFHNWKIDQINKVFEEKNLPRRCTVSSYIAKRTNQRLVQSNLSWTKYFRIIYPKVYKIKEGRRKKTLQWLLNQIYEDRHLFIWFGDDGCEMKARGNGRPSYRLHINNFTEGEAKIAQQWFKSNYDIEPRIMMWRGGSGNYSPVLMFRVAESKVIWDRISPYVLKLESMKHKFKGSIQRYIEEVERSPIGDEDTVLVNN